MKTNPLHLDKEKMRALGYQVIDHIVDHLDGLPEKRTNYTLSYDELEQKVDPNLPLNPSDPEQLITELNEFIASTIVHTSHPRFYSFIPSPAHFMSVMGDTMASGYNAFVGHWLAGSGPAMIETITIRWLCQMFDFPEGSGGIFLSGGSMANLTAVATARKVILDNEAEEAMIYYSDQTHSSMAKGLKILGFRPNQMKPVETNDSFVIDTEKLELEIVKDLKNGSKPLCIIGNAGTTNTGAVDDLKTLSSIARKYNAWFHIDGAYGAAAILSEDYKHEIKGIELADSITLDPHKWWFQTFECGCLIVKDRMHLYDTFTVKAEYLFDTIRELKEINYYDHGVQLSRSFKALKLYMTMKTFGLNAFAKAITHGIQCAEYVESILCNLPGWEIISPAKLAIINFRFTAEGYDLDVLNKSISNEILNTGYAMIITTRLNNRTVLRMCTISPETTQEDLNSTIELLNKIAHKIIQQ